MNPERRELRYARDFGGLAVFVRGLPCLVCRARPVDPAHVRSRGAGGHAWIGDPDNPATARGNLVPLCRKHHREQHDTGLRSFETKHGLVLAAEAERIGEEFAGPDAGIPF